LSTKLTHSPQNRSTLVWVVLGRPMAACSHSSHVFISDRHRVQCTTGLCSWPHSLSLIHRRFAVVDWRSWSVSASFCRRHSYLWVLLTNAVLVHGTTEPYFWVYWCRFRLDAITQAPAQHAKTEVIWLTTGRRMHQLPQQPLRVGSDLITPVRVVRDLGVYIDDDASMRSNVMRTTSLCFAVLRQLRSIRRSIPRTVFKSLVSCLVLPALDYCNSVLAGSPLHLVRRLQSVMNAAARLVFSSSKCDHITPHLRQLHWLTVSWWIDFKLAVLLYNVFTAWHHHISPMNFIIQ